MIIACCPRCSGRPYTTDLTVMTCPTCGSALENELASDSELIGRPMLPSAQTWSGTNNAFDTGSSWPATTNTTTNPNPFFWNTPTQQNAPTNSSNAWDPFSNSSGTAIVPDPGDTASIPIVPDTNNPLAVPGAGVGTSYTGTSSDSHQTVRPGNTVIGQIDNYSNTATEPGMYRRMAFQRLIDAVVYGQRVEDLLHRFTVRVGSDDPLSGNYVNVPVNVHGTIAGGMQLVDNLRVEVTGAYKDGVLMARHIYVLNAGSRVEVKFQRNYGGIAILLAILLVIGFIAAGGLGDLGVLFSNLETFLTTWVFMSLIVAAVCYFIFPRFLGRVPLVAVLVLGFLFALCSMNAFGLGNAANGFMDSIAILLSNLIGPVVSLLLLGFIIKLILGI